MTLIDFARLPANLSPAEQRVLFACVIAAANDWCHRVPLTRDELRKTLGIANPFHLRTTLRELEKLGLIVRVRNRRVSVSEAATTIYVPSRLFSESPKVACANCGEEKDARREFCRRCGQVYRSDREWQQRAIRLAVQQIADRGHADPLGIAVAVGRDAWRAPEGENQSGAVIPLLLSHGLITVDDWEPALRQVLGTEDTERLRQQRRTAEQRRRRLARAKPLSTSQSSGGDEEKASSEAT